MHKKPAEGDLSFYFLTQKGYSEMVCLSEAIL
jgi:hypothetical protein